VINVQYFFERFWVRRKKMATKAGNQMS
jgi:uncharacterized membrane protein